MASDDSSELSSVGSLSPPPPSEPASDGESDEQLRTKGGILKFFKPTLKDTMAHTKEPSPPPRKREPSPPHELVFADNPDIAFIVMFRNRFDEAFPKSTPNFGPQELENDVTDETPATRVENFLCALLGLILNRKQDVKAGHYGRALEEAISTHRTQWPPSWDDKSPLSGGASFAAMKATDRLTLLRSLILWSLHSSEAVRSVITTNYKQARHEDDLNQPLSVQPWGSDSDKRRYFLIEGRDFNSFRVYRESNPQAFKKRTWQSVADSVESIDRLSKRLREVDGGPKAKKLAAGIDQAIPRLVESQEKRAKRDYRQRQKDRWNHRPDPGFSLYEGRTRGKKAKYTFSDDEDNIYSDSTNTRRSTRNTRNPTPAESLGPVTTQSGRQIRPTRGTRLGESGPASVHGDTSDASADGERLRQPKAVNGYVYVPIDNDEEGEDNVSESEMGDDERDDDHVPDSSDEDDVKDDFDEDEDMLEDDDIEVRDHSHIVKFKVDKMKLMVALDHGIPTPASEEKVPSQENGGPPDKSTQAGDDKDVAMKSTSASTPSKQHVVVGGATRQLTPQATSKTDVPPTLPRTPSAGVASAPLAFRGSPEKPQMSAPRPIDVGLQP